MKRGDVRLAEVGQQRRPVVVLTRDEVIDVRAMVTVAEVPSSVRGLSVEVPITHDDVDLERDSVINCDGIHTVRRTMLTEHIGELQPETVRRVCTAVAYAIGC